VFSIVDNAESTENFSQENKIKKGELK